MATTSSDIKASAAATEAVHEMAFDCIESVLVPRLFHAQTDKNELITAFACPNPTPAQEKLIKEFKQLLDKVLRGTLSEAKSLYQILESQDAKILKEAQYDETRVLNELIPAWFKAHEDRDKFFQHISHSSLHNPLPLKATKPTAFFQAPEFTIPAIAEKLVILVQAGYLTPEDSVSYRDLLEQDNVGYALDLYSNLKDTEEREFIRKVERLNAADTKTEPLLAFQKLFDAQATTHAEFLDEIFDMQTARINKKIETIILPSMHQMGGEAAATLQKLSKIQTEQQKLQNDALRTAASIPANEVDMLPEGCSAHRMRLLERIQTLRTEAARSSIESLDTLSQANDSLRQSTGNTLKTQVDLWKANKQMLSLLEDDLKFIQKTRQDMAEMVKTIQQKMRTMFLKQQLALCLKQSYPLTAVPATQQTLNPMFQLVKNTSLPAEQAPKKMSILDTIVAYSDDTMIGTGVSTRTSESPSYTK